MSREYFWKDDSAGFWLINTDGTDMRRILPYKLYSTDWSPDGQWIAFDSNNDSPNGMNFIRKMKSDGSSKTRLAYTPTIGEVRQPSWANVSNRILHTRYVENSIEDLFVMNSSGVDLVRLTNDNNHKRSPRYSSNENKIAFISWMNNDISNIWWMDTDGSNIKN